MKDTKKKIQTIIAEEIAAAINEMDLAARGLANRIGKDDPRRPDPTKIGTDPKAAVEKLKSLSAGTIAELGRSLYANYPGDQEQIMAMLKPIQQNMDSLIKYIESK